VRRQLVGTVESLMEADPRVVVLLGDIGVFGFRNAFARWPERIYNVGICEQSTIGLAAGLAKEGLVPIVHSIAPFVVERCYEQLKVDFCYQGLGGNVVSVGGSYDYAALGCTHHCPGDVEVLRALPTMEIVVPGTPGELDGLFREGYADGRPTYLRLSERSNRESRDVTFGRATCLRRGSDATVVAVGPALDLALAATDGLDVTLLYYTTIAPFDAAPFAELSSPKVVLFEPFYAGTLVEPISRAAHPRPLSFELIGVPRRFLTDYGTAEEHDVALGLTPEAARGRLLRFLDA
jgi:transketolase